jgi:hypothetical protein
VDVCSASGDPRNWAVDPGGGMVPSSPRSSRDGNSPSRPLRSAAVSALEIVIHTFDAAGRKVIDSDARGLVPRWDRAHGRHP